MQVDALLPWLQFLLLLAVVGSAFYLLHLRMKHRQHYGIGHFGDDTREKTNCGSCGARVPADRATCEHCGEPLGDGDEPSSGDGHAADDEWGRDRERESEWGDA